MSQFPCNMTHAQNSIGGSNNRCSLLASINRRPQLSAQHITADRFAHSLASRIVSVIVQRSLRADVNLVCSR